MFAHLPHKRETEFVPRAARFRYLSFHVLPMAIASAINPSASARSTEPTNRRSSRLFTTGTLRCSLASSAGSASVGTEPA